MKILHTADWHIGSFKGPEQDGVNLRLADTINCLNSMVETAEKEQPDLVLVSGDVFHQAEIWQGRSHKELHIAREIIMKLSKCTKLVVVMRGTPNHDSDGIFQSLKDTFELVENVKVVIDPEVIQTEEADIVAIPGFDKGAFRAKFPGFSKEEENVVFTDELGKIVTGMRALCREGKKAILMSHYTVPGCNMESGQTQFLTQFEPVISQDMLIAAKYDLVCLGHIHRPQKFPDFDWYYSGAINAMNFNDEGQERGYWIHNWNPIGVWQSFFHNTPYREFLTIHWTVADVEEAIAHPELLTMKFAQLGVADKIVRIIYSCTADQKKIFNEVQITNALYEAGAFWKAGIVLDKLEAANRSELSKYNDPEQNLISYLQEKQIEQVRIDGMLERARPIIARAQACASTSEFFGTFIPKEISVKNYRNYAEQSFSFDDISFCTINGQNGAGKSSLFMDAIIDCLFEEPREGTTTGWIRNDEKARSGSISFTFSIGEKIFRVVRTRAKSGKGTLNISELVNGEWVDRSKEKYRDTQDEIVRILGMDSLTFKACVLIMQDQYGLFLEAGKEERVGVLSSLLGLGIYGDMESLAKDKWSELRRKIAKKNQTIQIYEQTIKGYGNPEEEMEETEKLLKAEQLLHSEHTKQKEDKSLILRMQTEAEERRNKVQAYVNTLTTKKAGIEQNILQCASTIASCDGILSDEDMIAEKVTRYKLLVDQDKELAEQSAIFETKALELARINSQILSETKTIEATEKSIEDKKMEIEGLSNAENDDAIRKGAADYEYAKKELDEAYEQERAYRSIEQERLKVSSSKSDIMAIYKSEKNSVEVLAEGYKKKAELLDTVQCVDITQAHCGFLADAIHAKGLRDEVPGKLADIDTRYGEKIAAFDSRIDELQKQLDAMSFDSGKVAEISKRVSELKPYAAKLEELNSKESRITLIRASIEHLQSNILEAQKRLTEGKLKGKEIEDMLPKLTEASEKHKNITEELKALSVFVDKANSLPVFKERKKNAENQRADEIVRLTETETELLQAQKELAETTGATVDISVLTAEIESISKMISANNERMSEYHQIIGSLQQKIDEIEKLQSEIKVIQKSAKELSTEITEYGILKEAFSQDGIPHQIIRSLVPRLTETSSSILGQMTGGKMGIEFQTEKEIKSNTNKEVVTLDILIEEYGKSTLPYLSKSGGEKVKASLSVILALSELKSSSVGIQSGMLFIDEPPFLDGEGIQAYCDALETIQKRYPDLKIMAITHDPTMKARFPQSLDVIKTDDGSKVIY